jgi:dephospho-CoA kinase
MIKIGLTGGIGSGKSYVCEIFRRLGVPVYNADERSKYLLNNNRELIEKVSEIFGEQAYENNELNRKYIASIVFNDSEKLQQLNQVSHPAVEQDFNIWCVQYNEKDYVIQEAAVLFESGAYKMMHKNILVAAPIDIRIKRVMARDGISSEQVQQRINNQLPTEKLEALADFVIQNNDKTLILPQILKLDKKIRIEWQNLVNG